MAKQAYISRTFRVETLGIIAKANLVIEEYMRQGYTLTLRQIYYQMIARDLFPESWIDAAYNRAHGLSSDTKNTEKNYKNLGSILSDARLAGLMDWDAIEDRGRNMRKLQTWHSPEEIIRAARASFRLNPWLDQPCYCQVWIEKEALIGVIERPCNTYRIPYIACKGYMSQSEMRAQAEVLLRQLEYGKNVYIFHFGDHDPSGIQMSEDITKRMELFMGGVQFQRLALNMDQIQQYNPVPNPAKVTDSRYNAYVAEFGVDDSWELDALTPQVIGQLIERAMTDLIDWDAWEKTIQREQEQSQSLIAVEENWQDVVMWMDMRNLISPAPSADDQNGTDEEDEDE